MHPWAQGATKGYKNNLEANESALKFEWFHMRDVGFMDSDGNLHLVGRIKEPSSTAGETLNIV